jgi:hypothetical protein
MHAGGFVRYTFFAVVAFFIFTSACGQKAELKLVDSSKIVTKLRFYSDEHLHTAAGAIPYSSIYSIRINSKDRKKAEFFLERLDSMQIKVIFDDAPLTGSNYQVAATGSNLSDSLRVVGRPPDLAAIVGVGGGLDYGGFGARGGVHFTQNVVLFGGVGYALAGLGLNGGLIFIFKPKSDLSFTMSAMYGYNAALAVEITPPIHKLYYGPSLGVGARYIVGKQRLNMWHVSVVYPFRKSEFNDQATLYGAQDFPILISVGFSLGIKKMK